MKSIYYVAVVTRAYRKALDRDPEMDKFKRDLFDVSHREYTTGFFFSKGPVEGGDDVSRPTSYGYERNYTFLGSIGEKTGENTYRLNCKNQIKAGQNIEFIGPDVPLLSASNYMLLDKDGFPLLQIDHGKEGYIKTDVPLKSGYIMRREQTEEKYV